MCRLKLSRLFCLLFALSVFFGSFGLSASAASDNLIDSNLSNWENLSDTDSIAFPITVTAAGDIYRLTLSEYDSDTYWGFLLDKTSLIAGHSYSLSFKLPTRAECNSAFGNSYSASVYENHFINSEIRIGIGFLSSSGELNLTDYNILYTINKSNYTNFFGKTLKASFIASSYTGTPVLFINITSLDGSKHTFYFSDFKLVDNDDNSAELTGIKGFLHSIRWDLVGGTCEEEDCPHSSGDNPHLSLSERMSSGFASMFQTIGDKFEEGSTLNVWFNGLSDKVGSINGSLTGLGDRISGFFSGLGDRISVFFSNLGDRMSTFFGELGSDIGGFFSDLKTNMSNWFSELGNKITTKFQEIGDKFTEFFEKFKPVVSFNFDWRSNVWISTSNGLIYESESYYYNAAVTDFFEVSEDFLIKFDFKKHPSFNLYVFQYNEIGGFVKVFTFNRDTSEYVLSPGYKYRFYYFGSKNINFNDYSDLNDFCGQYLQVYCDEGWVNALLYKAKMGLRSLFVPDEAFIATWKEELEDLLQERLGIIWDAGDFFVALIQTIGDLLTTTSDDIHYELPEMVIELNGQTYTLWQAQQVDFSFLEKNAFFAMLYKLYKAVLNVFLGIPLLNYAKKEMDSTLHN